MCASPASPRQAPPIWIGGGLVSRQTKHAPAFAISGIGQFWEDESRRDRKCGGVQLRALRLNRQKLPEKPLTP